MTQEQKIEPKEVDSVGANAGLHKSGEGFNLIAPRLEEVERESQKKFRVDIRVVLFVFFVVLVSLGVVGYNWYVRTELNTKKETLANTREDLEGFRYTVEANNQVLDRYALYNKIQEGFISSKEVLTFWQEVSLNLGEVRRIELSNGVNFEVFGRANNLRDVMKLWHFLSIDDRVSTVTLESVSISVLDTVGDSRLSFSFKGVLNLEYFNNRN